AYALAVMKVTAAMANEDCRWWTTTSW
ncbi:unnamed protein product, partial [Urochloa humidicola]